MFLSLALSLFVSSAIAQVETNQKFKDWQLVKEADAVLQTDVCRITTNVQALPIPVELSLSFPTRFDKPPTMTLRTAAGSKIQKASIPLNKKVSETFFLLSNGEAADVLWYAPLNLVNLVNLIADKTQLPLQVQIDGLVKTGKISLSGSTAAINAVAPCLKSKDILVANFQKELNTLVGETALTGEQTAQQLYIYVNQAYSFYREIVLLGSELGKVRASIKPLAVKEKEAATALKNTQGRLDKATAAMNSTDGKIKTAERRLTEIPAEVEDLKSRQPEADRIAAEKKAIYQPLKTQNDAIQKEIDTARASVRQADNALAERRRIIKDGESSIESYRYEARRLSDDNESLDREIQNQQRKVRDAREELSRYNVDAERRKNLEYNRRYKRDLQERETLRSQEQQRNSENSQAQANLANANSRLNDCKRVEKADCSSQQNEVNQAQSAAQAAAGALANVKNEIRRNEKDIRQAEDSALWQAERGRQDLADKLAKVERELDGYEDKRKENLNRIDRIHKDLIPNIEYDVRKARQEIPGWETRRKNAANAQAAATQKLADFRAANDFVRIEKEHVEAKAIVDGLAKGITDRQAESKKHTADLKTLKPLLAKQQAEVAKLTPPRDKARTNLDSIQTQLQPLRTRETEIVNLQTGLKPQYDEIRKLYQTLFKKLLAP